MSVAVRVAVPADAEAICTVIRSSITDLLDAEHKHDKPTLDAWLENKTIANALRWIGDSNRFAVVAVDAKEICGFGMLKNDGEVGLLYVAPQARFRGASKSMLAALEAQAGSRGIGRVSAVSSYTAQRFYRARGYQSVGDPVKGFGVTYGYPMAKSLAL